jgi:four helix bundle protein
MASQRFTDTDVWRQAHRFVLDVYEMTKEFPREELFGLTAQLRRAAVSIPANFAEGFKKTGSMDKARYYNIAQGSLEECRYYLILAQDLGYSETTAIEEKLDRVGRLLAGYTRSMISRGERSQKVVV